MEGCNYELTEGRRTSITTFARSGLRHTFGTTIFKIQFGELWFSCLYMKLDQ